MNVHVCDYSQNIWLRYLKSRFLFLEHHFISGGRRRGKKEKERGGEGKVKGEKAKGRRGREGGERKETHLQKKNKNKSTLIKKKLNKHNQQLHNQKNYFKVISCTESVNCTGLKMKIKNEK